MHSKYTFLPKVGLSDLIKRQEVSTCCLKLQIEIKRMKEKFDCNIILKFLGLYFLHELRGAMNKLTFRNLLILTFL